MKIITLLLVSFVFLLLAVSPAQAQNYDAYHALADLNCTATGNWYPTLMTIDGQTWHVQCDPLGHPLFNISVDAADPTLCNNDQFGHDCAFYTNAKYGSMAAWGTATAKRFLDWGFNSPYNYPNVNILPGVSSVTTKLPFIYLIKPGFYGATVNTNWTPGGTCVTSPVKGLYYGNSEVYRAGSNSHTPTADVPDFDDPCYQTALIWALGSSTQTIHNIIISTDHLYMMGLTIDETDQTYGYNGGFDFATTPSNKNQPRPAWLIPTATPIQTGNNHIASGGTTNAIYPDYMFHQKTDTWKGYVKTKYVTVAAMNAAWGTSYTTFGSSGTANGTAGHFTALEPAANGSAVTLSGSGVGPYTGTLTTTVAKHSVAVYVNGTMACGDSSLLTSGSIVPWANPAKLVSASTQTVKCAQSTNMTSASESGTTATYVTAAAHGLSNGNSVTVGGMSVGGYNVTGTATVTDSTHFTLTLGSSGLGSATGGYVSLNSTSSNGSINYTTGAISVSFNSPPAGAVTVEYVSNGWGVSGATGLMDEDGTLAAGNGAWGTCGAGTFNFPGTSCNYATLGTVNATLAADLKTLEYTVTKNWLSATRTNVKAAAPFTQFIGAAQGSWGVVPTCEVSQAMGQYSDIYTVVSPNPNQTMLDFIRTCAGDVAIDAGQYRIANPDSDTLGYQQLTATHTGTSVTFTNTYTSRFNTSEFWNVQGCADTTYNTSSAIKATSNTGTTITFTYSVAPTGASTTGCNAYYDGTAGQRFLSKALQGADYQTNIINLVSSAYTVDGHHPFVGIDWWQLYPNLGEDNDFGLFTQRDNWYDGIEDVSGVVNCTGSIVPPITCGGEPGTSLTFGNLKAQVTAANAYIISIMLSQPGNGKITGVGTIIGAGSIKVQ